MKQILTHIGSIIYAVGLLALALFAGWVFYKCNFVLLLVFVNLIALLALRCRFDEFVHHQDWQWDEFRRSKDTPQLVFRKQSEENGESPIIILENISSSPALLVKVIQLTPYGCWEKPMFYFALGVMRSIHIDMNESPKAICAIYQDIHHRKYVVAIAGHQMALEVFDWHFKELVFDKFKITRSELEVLEGMEGFD